MIKWSSQITLGPVRLVTLALVVCAFVWLASLNPVEEGHDLVAGVLVDESGECPGGWQPNDQRSADVWVYTCSRLIDGQAHLVSLDGDFRCNNWANLDTGEMGLSCEGEPWWPAN